MHLYLDFRKFLLSETKNRQDCKDNCGMAKIPHRATGGREMVLWGGGAGQCSWGSCLGSCTHSFARGMVESKLFLREWGVQAGNEPGPCKLEHQAQVGHQKLAWDK